MVPTPASSPGALRGLSRSVLIHLVVYSVADDLVLHTKLHEMPRDWIPCTPSTPVMGPCGASRCRIRRLVPTLASSQEALRGLSRSVLIHLVVYSVADDLVLHTKLHEMPRDWIPWTPSTPTMGPCGALPCRIRGMVPTPASSPGALRGLSRSVADDLVVYTKLCIQ
jgi:hypothetical protein